LLRVPDCGCASCALLLCKGMLLRVPDCGCASCVLLRDITYIYQLVYY